VIHVLLALVEDKDVDGRDKPGHDGELKFRIASSLCVPQRPRLFLMLFPQLRLDLGHA
jgi:hypothetical protein